MYRGGAEGKICQYLIGNNFIVCVIQLPSDFWGTSIATYIMVLKKNKSDSKPIFIDVGKECAKVTNNNELTPEDINRTVDTLARRAEEAYFSHLADYEAIDEQKYNLLVSTYMEAKNTQEKIDCTQLNAKIAQIVVREDALRAESNKIIVKIEE